MNTLSGRTPLSGLVIPELAYACVCIYRKDVSCFGVQSFLTALIHQIRSIRIIVVNLSLLHETGKKHSERFNFASRRVASRRESTVE